MAFNASPRWGEVARCGHYAKAQETARDKSICDAGSCGIVQNEARTSGSKWHKTDTGGSAFVRAVEWFKANRDSCAHPIVPTLRRRFGLSSKQAIDAIRAAGEVAR